MISTTPLLALTTSILLVLLIDKSEAVEIQAVSIALGPMPNLTGPLEPNFKLKHVQKFKVNQVRGAESFAFHQGHIYTGLPDGRVVDISDCGVKTVARLAPIGCRGPLQCGRLQGMRTDNEGRLVVADAYRGIFRIDLQTGAVEHLYKSNTRVGRMPPRYINDIAISKDGTILFTDSSYKWTRENDLWLLLEGAIDGRLLAYSDASNQAIVVLKDLAFPNGLELGPDDDYLLIAETSRAKVRKLNLSAGSSWLELTDFASNLPGLPDNIRKSGRGTYWVAMWKARHTDMSSMIDEYKEQPQMRAIAARMYSRAQIEAMTTKYGMVVELDANGDIVSSLQDPSGETLSSVTEANEMNGYLYLGSSENAFVSRVPTTANFHVERLLSNLKSTCRATRVNLGRLRMVLRRLVAIAELRRTLLAARKRQDEQNARQATTVAPIVSTPNDTNTSIPTGPTTPQTPTQSNVTESTSTNTTESPDNSTTSGLSESTATSAATTAGATPSTSAPTTAAPTTTPYPEDGAGGIVEVTTPAPPTTTEATSPATSTSSVTSSPTSTAAALTSPATTPTVP